MSNIQYDVKIVHTLKLYCVSYLYHTIDSKQFLDLEEPITIFLNNPLITTNLKKTYLI